MSFVIAHAHDISVKALGESASFLAAQPTFTELMEQLRSIEAVATCVEYLSEEQLHLLNVDIFQGGEINTTDVTVSAALARLIRLDKVRPNVQIVETIL